ncbi:MAG: GTPase ObgE [Spirochaetales bacterium]|nr:GTPase ObgE [Spirochaetales bacterium]
MKFVDEIEIEVEAGHGGAGSVHFLREKYRPMGGPDGGDGGAGGDVIIKTNPSRQTLGHYLQQRFFKADNGDPGRALKQSGKRGQDLILEVAPGTVVTDIESQEILGDFLRAGEQLIAARGGKGGLGNSHFASSTNQAPHYAQSGLPGERRLLKLELKLLADAGLVGLPNAGKSTLIARLTASKARIADYAFTTLSPNLGVLENEAGRRVLLADIPGIIEGAHQGAGLGLSFLRHIERVGLILYLLDLTSLDLVSDLTLLQNELASYSPSLPGKAAIVVLNKWDEIQYDPDFVALMQQKLRARWPELETIAISARDGRGLEPLKESLFEHFPEETLAERIRG